ncbi:MAG: restriction endonuclease subunit S [Acidobacteriota bacterium]
MTEELPEGWAIAALADISAINPRHDKTIDDETMVTFVPMAAISEDSPDFLFREERPLGDVRKGFTHFADGDVLFAKITPCMENGKGAVAQQLRNGLGCGTTEVHVIRPASGVGPLYLYRYLSQISARRLAKENFTGTAGQLRVPTEFIKTLCIPIPPSAEQRRIEEKLEKLLAEVERCKERMAKIPVLLKRFRQSVLAAACSGCLTADWRETHCAEREDSGNGDELPPGWSPVVVGDVIDDLRYGTSAKCSPQPNGSAVLRIPNIGSGIIDHSELKYARLPEAERKKLALVPGDVLMIRSNGSVSLVGKTAVVGDCEKGFAYAGYLIRLRVKPKAILPLFLHYCFASSDMRQQIEIPARSTSGVNNINSEEVRQLHLFLPPIEEQEEIVQRAAKLLALADRVEERYQAAKKQVDSLTQSILAKAFRGELVPTEAELAAREGRDYECAEALLQRIHSLKIDKPEPKGASRNRLRRRDG